MSDDKTSNIIFLITTYILTLGILISVLFYFFMMTKDYVKTSDYALLEHRIDLLESHQKQIDLLIRLPYSDRMKLLHQKSFDSENKNK